MGNSHVLMVDGDYRHLRAVEVVLQAGGYQMIPASDGGKAIELVAVEEPDLVLLAVQTPEISGFELCRRVREFSDVPIIMFSEQPDEADKVKALDLGADDFMSKPLNARELLARIRAILRRVQAAPKPKTTVTFHDGDLFVDLLRRRVFMRGREVRLTSTEYDLLRAFVQSAGRVLTPENLIRVVWGAYDVKDNSIVWQAVHRLRRKIEPDPQRPKYIHTRPGIGYIFGRTM